MISRFWQENMIFLVSAGKCDFLGLARKGDFLVLAGKYSFSVLAGKQKFSEDFKGILWQIWGHD